MANWRKEKESNKHRHIELKLSIFSPTITATEHNSMKQQRGLLCWYNNQLTLVSLLLAFQHDCRKLKRRNKSKDWNYSYLSLPTWPSPRKSSFSYRLDLDFTSSAMIANCHLETLPALLKVRRYLFRVKGGFSLTNTATYRFNLSGTKTFKSSYKAGLVNIVHFNSLMWLLIYIF